jgi:hypothetical protein
LIEGEREEVDGIINTATNYVFCFFFSTIDVVYSVLPKEEQASW